MSSDNYLKAVVVVVVVVVVVMVVVSPVSITLHLSLQAVATVNSICIVLEISDLNEQAAIINMAKVTANTVKVMAKITAKDSVTAKDTVAVKDTVAIMAVATNVFRCPLPRTSGCGSLQSSLLHVFLTFLKKGYEYQLFELGSIHLYFFLSIFSCTLCKSLNTMHTYVCDLL
jgi:hypothetical protein